MNTENTDRDESEPAPDNQRRFCPYCRADLWIRSCGHFDDEATRKTFIDNSTLPDGSLYRGE